MVKCVREILSCIGYNAEFVKLQLFFSNFIAVIMTTR